ncbi:ribbon-helix-helix domain-containing protein [Neomegalonema sp.]|uniref:ribbon-helix-helix domain-containing protein n=1 Tax=Neomegalonema sp. TaxID=2039713 RepID=UPI00263194FC|nr:ribbon-helix-helix domain-containing protein [Neomegalonema sp.]MDD2869959.1 ribbon-helix-helix domain-containing protein [Neomegalonema sp.]
MSGKLKLVKHSLSIRGHRTSVTLEAPFWAAFRALAAAEGVSLGEMAARIDAGRLGEGELNLSSAIRVRALEAALKGQIGAASS